VTVGEGTHTAGDGANVSEEGDVAATLRELRPSAPLAGNLEKRLAIATILASASTEPARARLGRLQIQKRLGGGGMGLVYRAFDPELRRLVAVKLLRGTVERRARSLIADEARALAQVNHPNVVVVYEIVDRDDELYFVMEHVAGTTLRAWLAAHPHARWPEVLEWFVQAGRGLRAAHVGGLVHRDFKPENVLIGDDGRARVVDFGLAAFDETLGVAGTPHYLAPELLRAERASEASDQFAFCRALADALSDRAAPEAVLAIVTRGLADDPTDRHPNMESLVRSLDAARFDEGLRARALLLDRVERLWLRGVLDRSLEDGGVDLALTSMPDLIDPPWREWTSDDGRDVTGEPDGIPDGLPSRSTSRELVELLRRSHDALLVVGEPGSGKTIALLRLARELHRASALDRATPVPVVLSLSSYRAHEPLARFVVDELVAKYGLPRPSVERWLERGEISLLLDGLDETPSTSRRRVVAAINELREKHAVSVVVTSRDAEYVAIGVRLRFGGAVRVEPLGDEAVHELLGATPTLDERVSVDAMLLDKLRNPLLLALCARACRDDRESSEPASWTVAYERYLDRAFERCTDEKRRRVERPLRYLARTMQRLDVSDLWIERLTFDWVESRAVRVVGYLLGVMVVLGVGLSVQLATLPLHNPIGSVLTLGLGVPLATFAFTRGRLRPVERVQWSWRRAVALLPLTLSCGAVLGVLEGLRGNLASRLVGALLTAFVLTVAFALGSSERPTPLRTNEGIRRSLSHALSISFGFAIPAGLLFGLVFEPELLMPLRDFEEHAGDPRVVGGVTVASIVLSVLFFIYGGFTAIIHGVLRFWLAWRTPLPFHLPRLLDHAVKLDLMRQVGGGYVFLHRTFAEHLARVGHESD